MEALCKAIPGSAKCKRHKRCCQGSAAVYKQVTNGVRHRVLADKKPLEDLPLGTNGDAQGEHRGPQLNGPTLRHCALVEQEVEREADREGREGVGQLVVRDDLLEEAEHEAHSTHKRCQREEYVEESGTPVASKQVSKREPEEGGDYQRGLYVAQDDQRHQQDAQRDTQRMEERYVQRQPDQGS